jgi:RimJ/RimL family protein N-acetyltransferase
LNLRPTLVGATIELRPLEAGDFEALFKVASDPLVWEQHPNRDRYQPEVFREFFDGAIASSSAFIVVDRSSGETIGSTRFYEYSSDRREIAVGYTFLNRAYWGGKTNAEMKSLLLAHAFLTVDSVVFHVGRENHRSRRALEKIGAREEGYIERHRLLPDGSWQGTCLYRIRKPS